MITDRVGLHSVPLLLLIVYPRRNLAARAVMFELGRNWEILNVKTKEQDESGENAVLNIFGFPN